MIRETMTSTERILAAVNLEVPDRVPVAPLMYQFVLRHKGLPIVPLAGGDPANWPRMMKAAKDTADELGGYDAVYAAGISWPISSWRLCGPAGGRRVTPGQDGIPRDFSVQYEERETMTLEDYDTIIERGWNDFFRDYYPRVTGITLEQADAAQKHLLGIYKEDAKYWQGRDVAIMSGALVISCEMTLSLMRTLPRFMIDLHRYPERVKAAMEAMVPDFIQNTLEHVEASGIPWVVFSLERGSGAYFNLRIYEEMFFPQLKKLVDTFAARGFINVLHFDTDWTLNFPYLKDLPARTCICELDSTSDIFKAKEILHGHMCIMGDVPPSLLSLGTTEEVVDYCERLIDVCGKGGGFILSTGCECPVDAKFENVKAMVDTAKNYPPPRS
jgi:hypothetical protein